MNLRDRFRHRRKPSGGELACRELVEIITDYLEGALPPADRARFERHLEACGDCSLYLEQMRQTIRVTGSLAAESIPPAVLEHLLQAFRAWNDRD